jgi:hypothetical protein
MGMAEIRIAEPERRDRLLLISAFAMALLTMLGRAGESLGMDRLLKSNTSKTRTHSLFRQGCMLSCPFSIGLHDNSRPDFLFPVDVADAGMRGGGRALSDG